MPLRKVMVENVYYGNKEVFNSNDRVGLQTSDTTQSPLCESCWQFLNGLPQKTTEDDIDWFQNLLEAEHEGGFEGNLKSLTDERKSPQDCFYVNDFESLVSAAMERRCHLCFLIRSRFARDQECGQLFLELEKRCAGGDILDCKVRIAVDRNWDVGCFPYKLRVDFTLPATAEQGWVNLNMAADLGYEMKLLDIPLAFSTSSDLSFVMVADWLSTCLNNHQECKSLLVDHDTSLPARLIDTEGVERTGTIALHMTKHNLQPYQYMVLSHCWGTGDKLLLTTSTQSELERGVQLDRLTLNFQHAVEITRRLGYQYLWIDCLCIQQDSLEDWAQEASKMASIYGNAVCCIAASASSDSEGGGCYQNREPFLVQPLRIHKDLFPNLQVFDSSDKMLISEDSIDLLWATRCRGPLDQRGWILQEHVLAPRTLHYTDTQIFWECRRLTASEAWPAAVFEHTSANPLDGRIKTMFDLSRILAREHYISPAVSDLQRLYRRWTSLVEAYTKRSLTYQKDKLLAMSGLADVMMSLCRDDYIAGLWRNDLLRGLAWSVQTNESFQCRPSPYRAPTWSWASVDNEIQYDWAVDETHDVGCTIHDVSIDLLDKSPTGRIKSGKLIATGLFRRASWARHPVLNTAMRFTEEDVPGWMGMSRDLRDAGSHSTVYLFQLFQSYQFDERMARVSRLMGGLVLIPTENADEYERVGYVNADQRFRYDKAELSQDKILSHINENDEWRYLSDGWTLKRITIV